VYVASSLALSSTSPEFLPGILNTDDKASLLLMGLGYGLLGGGFLEELGWTGFAVPRLRLRHGVLGTGLIVGLLWGAYHFSVIFWASRPSGALALGLILPLQLFAWLPAYRVLMVWVYDWTESLLVAMLMHASLTAGMLILQPLPLALAGVTLLTWLLVFAAAWWVVVAAVAVATGGKLARHPALAATPGRCQPEAPATTSRTLAPCLPP
jgi:membrane protease YdiL (CAAX protease family)